MSILEILWCFYNSPAFKIPASVVLFGVCGTILTALATLPGKEETPHGSRFEPYDRFNAVRRATRRWAGITLAVSILAPIAYFLLLYAAEGKTCDMELRKMIEVVGLKLEVWHLTLALYSITILVILFWGRFFFTWQDALRKHRSLSGGP